MDELWMLRPDKNTTVRIVRPVLLWRRSGTICPMVKKMSKGEIRLTIKRTVKYTREHMFKANGKCWTQGELAEELGVLENTYAKWEQDKATDNNFPLYLVPVYCEITGLDPWQFLTGQAPASAPSKRKAL